MFTAMHTPHKLGKAGLPRTTAEQTQLRHDRIVAAAVGLIIIGLIALLSWLSASGVAPEAIEYDYWMMP